MSCFKFIICCFLVGIYDVLPVFHYCQVCVVVALDMHFHFSSEFTDAWCLKYFIYDVSRLILRNIHYGLTLHFFLLLFISLHCLFFFLHWNLLNLSRFFENKLTTSLISWDYSVKVYTFYPLISLICETLLNMLLLLLALWFD